MLQSSSIKKLNEIYRICDNSCTDINNLKFFIQQTITEVIRAESAKVKGEKFSLYDFVEKRKNYRPVMECVYHDSGLKIASDGTALIALKEDYDPSLEGRMFKKNGEEVTDGIYPKWRMVVPKRDNDWIPVEIDEKKFNDWIEQRRAAYKAEFGQGCKWCEEWQVRINGHHTEAERFSKLISAAKKLGTNVIYLHKTDMGRPWLVESENGIAITMPFWDKDEYVYLDL